MRRIGHLLVIVVCAFFPSSAVPRESGAVIEIKDERLALCPTFHLTLTDTGLVRYQGFENVTVKGIHEWTLGIEATNALFAEFDASRFLDLDDKHDTSLTKYKKPLDCGTELARRIKRLAEACKGRTSIEVEYYAVLEAGHVSVTYRKDGRSKVIQPHAVSEESRTVALRLKSRVQDQVGLKKRVGENNCTG